MNPDLTGKAVIVTGGTPGIGAVIAQRYLDAGADVLVCGRTPPETLPAHDGREARFVQADVRQPEPAAEVVDAAVKQFGRLDILVNNAGGGERFAPEEYPDDRWRALIEVHLHAAFDLSQQAATFMLKRGRGKIINIGSVICFEGGVDIAAYAAAKQAIESGAIGAPVYFKSAHRGKESAPSTRPASAG